MNQGIYEALVTKLISSKLNELERNSYYIKEIAIDKAEASSILSQHLSKIGNFILFLFSTVSIFKSQKIFI